MANGIPQSVLDQIANSENLSTYLPPASTFPAGYPQTPPPVPSALPLPPSAPPGQGMAPLPGTQLPLADWQQLQPQTGAFGGPELGMLPPGRGDFTELTPQSVNDPILNFDLDEYRDQFSQLGYILPDDRIEALSRTREHVPDAQEVMPIGGPPRPASSGLTAGPGNPFAAAAQRAGFGDFGNQAAVANALRGGTENG